MKRVSTVLVISLVVTLVLPLAAHAAGTLYIYPGVGVGSAKLGSSASTAVSWLKARVPLAASGRDSRYTGQTVYYYFFGRKMSTGRYPLELYAKPVNGVRKVFIFQVNQGWCASYYLKTTKGVRVGTTEASLKSAYGSALKRYAQSAGWVRYSMGTKPRTDFYVRYGKVQKILVQTW